MSHTNISFDSTPHGMYYQRFLLQLYDWQDCTSEIKYETIVSLNIKLWRLDHNTERVQENNVDASNQPFLGKEVKRNIMMVALYKKVIINNTVSSVKLVIDTNQ